MKKNNLKTLLLLHILLMVYSMSGICSKMAAKEKKINIRFVLFYAVIIFLVGIYAIGWQHIIKRLDLTVAFANKAITVVWGIIWGFVFFRESITIGKIVGAMLIIAGVVLYSLVDKEDTYEE